MSSVETSLSDRHPDEVQRLYDDNVAIPPSHRCTHPDSVINLDTGSASPVFRRPYRVPQSVEPRVSTIIDKWLEDGTIERAPAGCLWNSPLVIASRPHDPSDVRVCLDPRRINSTLLNGDNFPSPIVTEIIDKLAGGAVFSSLDLKCGFNQFTVKAEDRPKLAFTWHSVQYMFVGVPFGLTHLSSAFQRVLSNIFSGLPYVVVYIDNIYVFSSSIQDHTLHLIEVLARLNFYRLRLNSLKCLFYTDKIEVLGFLVSTAGVSIQRDKLRDLEVIPPPTTGKQLQAFLGFTNFFRRFSS